MKKLNAYHRYRLAFIQLGHLLAFMRNSAHKIDTLIIDGSRYRLTKLQDGSVNIELVDV